MNDENAQVGTLVEGDGPRTIVLQRPQRSRRWRFGAFLLAPLAVGFALLAVIGTFYEIPYYSLAPGSVRDTQPMITTEGEAFEADGQVFFTTVSVRGRITLWGALAGWVDPAVDVVHESEILQGQSKSENRERNVQLMLSSKNLASRVALTKLGYQVDRAIAALITDVVVASPADGILEKGDVILAIDGVPVVRYEEVVEEIQKHAPGDPVVLLIRRFDDDQRRLQEAGNDPLEAADLDDPELERVTVVLAEHEEREGKGFLGVSLDTRYADDLPFDVTIDSGGVGGPSAGLAFTLGVLDKLTPGELTGGGSIAVTGTISPDGTVGPIGGVAQKAAAVRRAGIDTFIVPSALTDFELDAARDLGGDDVEIVPVATLDEAIAALQAMGGSGIEA